MYVMYGTVHSYRRFNGSVTLDSGHIQPAFGCVDVVQPGWVKESSTHRQHIPKLGKRRRANPEIHRHLLGADCGPC